jgi:ABC-type multidrug transport system fused ATPase/permease subunit
MRLGTYAEVTLWMVKDTLLRNRWQNLLGTSLQFAGLSAQVIAVTLTLGYAQRLESNTPLDIVGFEFIPQASIPLLVFVAAASGGLLLISSLMTWASQKIILNLRRGYYEFCMERLFRLLKERGAPQQLKQTEGQVRALFMLVRRDGLYCSRYYGALIGAIVPGVTAAAALATCIYTDWTLTIALFAALGVIGPILYRGNRQSSGLSNQVDQRAPACAKELRGQLLEGLQGADKTMVERPDSDAWMDAYMGRLGAAIHSDLVVNLLMSAAISTLVAGVGYQSITSHAGWGRIVIYLVALRYFLVHLKGLARMITTMNQFYVQSSRYRAYVLHGQIPIEGSPGDTDDGMEDL